MKRPRQEIPESPDDAPRLQVPMRIIVPANDQHSGMVTLSDHDQVVQVAKIPVVVRKQDPIRLNRMGKMNGIVITAQANICRYLDVMARLSKQPSEECAGRI